jgi:stage II sporulation protein D
MASLLAVSSFVFAQDNSQQQTRPRRAQAPPQPAAPSTRTVIETERLTDEPIVRIGLATDARSVTISTSGRLLSVTEPNAPPVPLGVARLRLEPHLLAPPPATLETESFRVELAGLATRAEAERISRELREQAGEESETGFDAATNTWRLRAGRALSANAAEELRARLEDAGFTQASVVDTQSARAGPSASAPPSGQAPSRGAGMVSSSVYRPASPGSASPSVRATNGNMVRPVSRSAAAMREVVAYAAGSAKLFSSSAPVTFAAEDEQSAPVRFNEKPYRGRLEVFTNPRGALTVVNVISLEDYVRGVVPNELSPGSYPAIEALKAQAVAARTYAVKNRNGFAAQGFDLLPTTRSQVYGGVSTEHPLSTRAVEETRGIVATYQDEPINALYTSTCGGRTEDAENIFSEATPYLRSRECSLEGHAALAPFTIKSSRELPDIREEGNAALARDAALLAIHGFSLSSRRMTDAWLSAPATIAEARNWLATVARLARQSPPAVTDETTRPPGFSTALAAAVYGQARADTLLDGADVEYLLAFRDAADVPAENRADVALLLRDGFLSLYPDATLRPREPLSRARMIRSIARLMEARGSFGLQKGTTRPTTGGALVLRSSKNRDQPVIVGEDAYLFRAYGDSAYQMRSLALVGGEPVTFHVNARGEVDYLEVRPAPNGASAERFSPFTNWTTSLTLSEAQSRLARWARGTGTLLDLRIAARGSSRRATDLELVGTNGTAHVRGGRIRSALGLREQLFVIDRRYDDAGRLTGFAFTGRGWGHGVGLCQVGAYGLARQGLSYDKILKAYYTGIELKKLY